MPLPSPAVFLDRDGTLIRNVDYINDPETWKCSPTSPTPSGG